MAWWQSIRFRLPLVLSVLFLAVMAAFAWVGYERLEGALFQATGERLEVAADQLRVILESSVVQILGRGAEVAEHPAIVAHLREPTDRSGADAQEILGRLSTGDQMEALIELWSAAGDPLLAVGGEGIRARIGENALPLPPEGMAPLRKADDLVYVEAASPVPGPAGPLGWVVQRRPVSGGEAVPILARLIGPGAAFFLGNLDGSLWTDLNDVQRGPPIALPAPGEMARYDAETGEGLFGTTSLVTDSPWVIWVEMPDARIVAPAREFLRSMVEVTLLLALVGTLAAWLLSRRLTIPLVRLAEASRSVGQGPHPPALELSRPDEVGELSLAFDAMAREVWRTRQDLEKKVAERTAELESAYRTLSETQDQLVRREKLATLGQLAGGVGHELRNPLGVMTNALYYIEMVLQDPPARVADYLGILRRQIGISEKIVSDLLDFARVRKSDRSSTPLEPLVDEQLRRLGPLDRVEVVKDFPGDLPAALVDAGQIGQVVFNLMMNAVQAMDEAGGTLTLRGRTREDGAVILEVEDEGDGIAPEHLETIFEPLFTTRARGIGLGLAVCRTLLTGNDGSLTVESTPGAGTTFTLTLPGRRFEEDG